MRQDLQRGWLRLLPLALAVLGVHLTLLQVRAQGLPAAKKPESAVGPLTTRSIEPTPAATPAGQPTSEPATRPGEAATRQPVARSSREQAAEPPATAPDANPVAPRAAGEQAAPAAAPSGEPQHLDTTAAAARSVQPQKLAIPHPLRIRYDVTLQARGLSLQGQAQLDWRHDASDYQAQLELSAPFAPPRMQRSTGRITSAGLAPSHFWDKGRRGEQAAHFERDKGKISFSNNRPDAELLPGAQDRLSVVLQLSALIGGAPGRYPAGTQIGIPTAGTSDCETWVFTVEGEEDLRLPGGAVHAIKVQRNPRKEFDQKVELWLAPRMDYAPVRLRLTNPNGDWVDQRWAATDKG